MVLQVPNTPDPNEIGRALDTIYERYPDLPQGSVAHVFGDHTTQQFGNRDVPYIEPQRVQDSRWVRVLIAKDAISTGWDCPRAEVMVSFRSASDRTHITQLLGRLVRSPLARRIPGNERLNAVDCLLPKFDRKTVVSVVEALMAGDDTLALTPGRILINPAEMKQNPKVPESVWQLFETLPSQTRPERAAKPAKRLTALAQELADDGLLDKAGWKAHTALHEFLDRFQSNEKDRIAAKRKAVLTVDGKTIVANIKSKSKSFDDFWEDADMPVIEDAYRRAARIFTPDVSRTYADHIARNTAGPEAAPEDFLEAIIEARVSIAGLGLVTEIQAAFDAEADKLATEWLTTYDPQIKALSDDRKEAYRQIVEMSTQPQDVNMVKPEDKFEPTKVRENGKETDIPTWKDHLLCDGSGDYPAELRTWESKVVEIESKREGFGFWFRNPSQPGQSSLGIAYLDNEQYKIVRPDFIFFATHDGHLVADLIDPHGHYLADALPKLRGLALYAATHGSFYRRIESIVKTGEQFRALDLTREDVREAISSSTDVASLYSGPLADDYGL